MKTWDIQKTQFKVADFVNWAKKDELNLSPMFQRRAVWAKGAKSYLVDTVLRGLPIPPLVLRDLPPDVKTFQSVREVVDGQQRLRTLLSYIAPQVVSDYDIARDDFRISKSHNPDHAGKGFRELPEKHQRQILNYQFMVHIFPSETDDRDILEIFARMNSTGTKLNNQELRNAMYFGEFKTHAFAFAAEHLDLWRNWGLFSYASIARMEEVEFTSELFILATRGISDNKKSVIDFAYSQFDEEFPGHSELIRRIRKVLEIMDSSILKQKPELGRSKALVYAAFASLYDKLYGLGSSLESVKPRKLSQATIDRVASLAEHVLNQKARKEVLLAFEARSSQAKNRRVLFEYINSPV